MRIRLRSLPFDPQDEGPDIDDTTPPAEEPDCGSGTGCGRE
ncbi:hypothetical protein [Streptomyces alkaliterrae]|nr:hypothetical protein [Streptomyces alkaliterrae]